MSVLTYISRHLLAVAALLLIASTLLVYSPIKDFQFINYDDNLYVTSNPLAAGLPGDHRSHREAGLEADAQAAE